MSSFCLFYKSYSMAQVTYLTEEGLANLRKELEHLRSVERPAISRQIAEARDKGDLSENAEYDAAKEAQGMLEMKIAKLENTLANAKIIDTTRLNVENIQILNKVKIKNLKTGAVLNYQLVTETEANLKENKISIGTPIAKALLGKKCGDVVDVQVPAGMIQFEVLEISI